MMTDKTQTYEQRNAERLAKVMRENLLKRKKLQHAKRQQKSQKKGNV
tara:strand:+ start:2168 stop:2308 length:141 start_codon:yes stop_codon:yes gene_type:complete